MDLLRVGLLGVLLPGLIACVGIVLVGLIPPRRAPVADADAAGDRPLPSRGALWLVPPVLALAYLPADAALRPGLVLWARESVERLPTIAVIAAALAALEILLRPPAMLRHALRLVLFAAVAWAVLEPLHRPGEFGGAVFWLVVALLGAAMAVSAGLAARGIGRLPPPGSALVLWLVATATATLLVELAHYAIGGQRAGGVAAAMGGAAVAAVVLRRRRAALPPEAAVVVVALLGALAISGRWFGGTWPGGTWQPGLPSGALVLVLLAPAALAAPERLAKRAGPGGRTAVAALVAIALLGVAAAWGVLASPGAPPAEEDPYAEFLGK